MKVMREACIEGNNYGNFPETASTVNGTDLGIIGVNAVAFNIYVSDLKKK